MPNEGSARGVPLKETPDVGRAGGAVDQRSSSQAKITLFRSLFRGRDDLYARRFETVKTGKSGYAPACANEWVRGICEKPRIKCAECPHRRFLPLTDDVIRWHLSGQDDEGKPFVTGAYAMLPDETCFFLAVDFDKQDWREDATAFLQTCRRLDIPAALERSRSGRGGHVWFFFAEAVPASLARMLGSYILTETMEGRPDVGMDSYDRFFPNQDTLPLGGFGSLIALPLQKQARERGNTVFLGEDLVPFPDQWSFLSTVRRISRTQAEELMRDAEHTGRILGVRRPQLDEEETEPWTAPASRRRKEAPIAGELPRTLQLVLGDEIYIDKQGLNPGLRNRLVRVAAFQNPEFYTAQAMRLSTYGTPRIISCADDRPRHIGLPRGCLDDVRHVLSDLHVTPALRDERRLGQRLDVRFAGTLRPDQQRAADALRGYETGVLAAATAFGKTVIAAWLIAERGVSTLVLVHRRQLLDQWVDRLSAFLDLPPSGIGRIGGGRRRRTGLLDVAVIQSLVRKGVVDDCVGEYGHLIVDECHHLSAHSFEQVARRAKARYVLGLSATVTRKDGHHPIIFMQCGPVRYRVGARAHAALQPFTHSVVVHPTGFQSSRSPDPDKRIEFQALYKELIDDNSRNSLICSDVLSAVADGRSPLVLTERHEHLDRLADELSGKVPNVFVLRGTMGRKQRDDVARQLADVPSTEGRVLMATGKYIGEGFDDGRLDTLFLTLPISWRGTVAQYVGRLHRLHEGKRTVVVHDYADLEVAMLARMFDRRCRAYEAIGYTISVPASAIPGWPAKVPLPADPLWKRDYSGSVRRLARDGVDVPLATLFLDAARSLPAQAEGQSRSATEEFLWRRLQTLEATEGRFRLNGALPVAFDGWSQMEVDFLCDELRVAIELDGSQHLADAAAYRRDRRKDQLLQENGYLVLRFLAEDVAKDLDGVLDAILRALTRRREGTGRA